MDDDDRTYFQDPKISKIESSGHIISLFKILIFSFYRLGLDLIHSGLELEYYLFLLNGVIYNLLKLFFVL